MALQQLHQGITREKTQNGIVTSVVYYGTKTECADAVANASINGYNSNYGRLESVALGQIGANIYSVTYKYTTAGYVAGTGGGIPVPPSTEIGSKSYTLDCAMLSTPLEQHTVLQGGSSVSDYRVKWNHYLAQRVSSGGTASAPAWWSSAGNAFVMPESDAVNYRILDSLNGLPMAEGGYTWVVAANPDKPGVTSFDEASYTLTMLERQRTYGSAATIAAAKANKTFTNSQVGQSGTFSNGNWKCDRATVAWDGEYWIITLTFTYSERTWDPQLYTAYTGDI